MIIYLKEFLRKYPSGKLDRNTFIETYKEFYPQNDSLVSCEYILMILFLLLIYAIYIFLNFSFKRALFNAIDINHDNNIDFSEFLFLAAIGNRTASLDERLDIIFDL